MRKILLLLTAFCVLFTGCNENRIFTQSRFLMGTLVTITLQHKSSDKANAAFDSAFNEIARIEKLMSPYNPHSDIFRANHSGSDPVKISNETFTLIREALRVSDKTGGTFDITYSSIADLWNYRSDNFSPPSRTIVNSRKKAFNYSNIILNTENQTITLKNNAKIGLGGIGKGYAIKKAVLKLKEKNIPGGIVEAGGDIQVIGAKLGKPWKIGIQHPRKKNDLAATLALHDDDDSVATSGDYQRFRIHNGTRYHHIVDPGTGFPSRSGLISVSVVTNDPVLADAWATALFIMGAEKGSNLLKKNPHIQAIFITSEFTMFASRELKKQLHVFDIEHVKWF